LEEYQEERESCDANYQGDEIDILLVNDENRHWLVNDLIGKGVCRIKDILGAFLNLDNIPYQYAKTLHSLPAWIRQSCPKMAEKWDEVINKIRDDPEKYFGEYPENLTLLEMASVERCLHKYS